MPEMGRPTIDLTGQTFGRLLVLAYAGRRKKNTLWRCKCLACGSVKTYYGSNLRCGRSTQCDGCPAKPPKRKSDQRHRQPGYLSWKKIVDSGQACKRWLTFEKFIADMGKPPKGKRYLVRLDPAKPYRPSNCTWSAFAKAKLLTHNGQTMSLTEWAREIGLSREALYLRLKKMPVREALSRPPQKR